MVKVLAPAMSMEASGQLGKALVFSKWKGRAYVRSLVKPTNPRTITQVGMRTMMAWLTQHWKDITEPNQATWEAVAAQTVISPFNAYVSYNQKRWRQFLGMSDAFPAAETANIYTNTIACGGGQRFASLAIVPQAGFAGPGILIFRHTVTGFTPNFQFAVKILKWTTNAELDYTDAPLAPNTYYYRTSCLTNDGQIGAPATEDSAIVT